MHVCECVCVYGKYQNPKINREGIILYGVYVYACYSSTLISCAARRMTYTQTRIRIPSLNRQNKSTYLNSVITCRIFFG